MDYFTKSERFSGKWSLTYAGNKIFLHKKIPITNINQNLGDSVVEGTVCEPNVNFIIDMIKYCNIFKLLKKTPKEQKLEYSKK